MVQPFFCIVDTESCSVIYRIDVLRKPKYFILSTSIISIIRVDLLKRGISSKKFFSSQFSLNITAKRKFIYFHLSKNLSSKRKVYFSPLIRESRKKFNFFPLILKPFTVSPEFTSTLVKQKFQAALKLLKISSSLKLCQLCFNARIASKNIWSGNLNKVQAFKCQFSFFGK